LWSATYDRELEDIFAVQDDIAQSVVKELREALLGETPDASASAAIKAEIQAAARGRGENAEAYRLNLQANFHYDRLTPEDFAIAIHAYREALKLDPNYALAWTGLSIVYAYHTGQGWPGTAVDEGFRLAREAAERAIQLAPDLAEAHDAMGVIRYMNDWDWKGAEASFGRALELAPGNVRVIRNAAELLRARGRFDEAIALLRHAVELDPLSGVVYRYLARSYLASGQLDEAQTAIRKSLELNPHAGIGHYYHSEICRAQGRLDEALEAAKREIHDSLRLHALAMVYHAQGRHAESDAALHGGWYRSGDLAEMDDEGYLTIKGRLREVIRSGGETIAPSEVEAAVGQLGAGRCLHKASRCQRAEQRGPMDPARDGRASRLDLGQAHDVVGHGGQSRLLTSPAACT